MKTCLTAATALVALLSFATLAHADDSRTSDSPPKDCASVEVQNLHVGQGPLMLAAYTDAESFRKTAVSKQEVAVNAATMQLKVCGLSGPSVALTLFQDLNRNGKLDANPFGMPTEPWGASGKPLAMSAPTWESAHVALDGSTIVIKLSK